jgi:hypothetical protein
MEALSLVLSVAAFILSALAFRNSRRKALHPLLHAAPKVTLLPEKKTEWDD